MIKKVKFKCKCGKEFNVEVDLDKEMIDENYTSSNGNEFVYKCFLNQVLECDKCGCKFNVVRVLEYSEGVFEAEGIYED